MAKKAIEVVSDIYALTKKLPSEERFGLASQLQRASISIAANIAEGHGRGTRADYARFLDMANGSVVESETFLVIVRNLYSLSDECSRIEEQLREIGKMLVSLRSKLRRNP